MNYRFMRILLFYDLPVGTSYERQKANRFRKDLINEGFIMLQESVYCKLVLNQNCLKYVENKLRLILPPKGNILMLTITEKQFSNISFLRGSKDDSCVDVDSRVIIL